MSVMSPGEPIYYYEVSAGEFRLVYFLPPDHLKRLAAAGRIEEDALSDYPDGLDLPCSAPSYEEFAERYGYRPPVAPEAVRRVFYATLTGTSDWRTFRGSGMIAARELDARALGVEAELASASHERPGYHPPAAEESLGARRRRKGERGRIETEARRALEDMEVAGVDPARTLGEQGFGAIAWEGDTSAQELFTRLQRKGGS